jgi:CheY-like chemotaxis protein
MTPEPPTILLVEDNEDNRMVYRTILQHFGFRITEAADGVAGLKEFFTGRPDLLIADISIPWVDGWEMIKIIRKYDHRTPILVLTAHALATDRAKAMEVGATAYLAKPAEPRTVVDTARRLIEEADQRTDENEPIGWEEEIFNLLSQSIKKLVEARAELYQLQNPAARSGGKGRQRKGRSAEQAAPPARTDVPYDALRALLQSVFHSLKGELATIAAGLQFLGLDEADEESAAAIQRSARFSQSLIALASEALHGGTAFTEDFDLVETVREAVELATARYSAEIDLSLSTSHSPVSVTGNRVLFLAVILEILRNAVTASRHHGRLVDVMIGDRDGSYVVAVQDHGPGFDPAVLDVLGTAPVARRGGLGLGLYLSEQIVARFGARLEYGNREEGAIVTMIVPRIVAKEER